MLPGSVDARAIMKNMSLHDPDVKSFSVFFPLLPNDPPGFAASPPLVPLLPLPFPFIWGLANTTHSRVVMMSNFMARIGVGRRTAELNLEKKGRRIYARLKAGSRTGKEIPTSRYCAKYLYMNETSINLFWEYHG
jgi:hypothetical protein